MLSRRGLGDCFVGLIFSMETSTIFVALRGILALLGLNHTKLYKLNYILMTLAFFLVRMAGIPYMYRLFASQMGQSVMDVAAALKWHCNAGSLALVSFQGIWFSRMLLGCWKIITKGDKKQD